MKDATRMLLMEHLEDALTECNIRCGAVLSSLIVREVETWLAHHPDAFLEMCADHGLVLAEGSTYRMVAERIEPLAEDSDAL